MKDPSVTRNDAGVSIILEYLFSLVIMVIIFSIMIMLIGDITSSSDRIVLKEEFDIIANDIANRISAYSSEVYMINSQTGTYNRAVVNDEVIYFDLPQLVSGKQYKVDITYIGHIGTVKVTFTANSNVYSTATFWSDIPVKQPMSFYSQPGNYVLYLDNTGSVVMENNI